MLTAKSIVYRSSFDDGKQVRLARTSGVSRVLEGRCPVQASAASGRRVRMRKSVFVVSDLSMHPVLRFMWWTVFRSMVV